MCREGKIQLWESCSASSQSTVPCSVASASSTVAQMQPGVFYNTCYTPSLLYLLVLSLFYINSTDWCFLPVSSVPCAETPLHVLHWRHVQVLLHVVQAVLGHVGDPKVVVRPHLSKITEQRWRQAAAATHKATNKKEENKGEIDYIMRGRSTPGRQQA